MKIKNGYLELSISFLEGLTLKNKESRYRTRVANALKEAIEDLITEERALLAESGLSDENGNPLDAEALKHKKEEVKLFKEQQTELFEEVATITVKNYPESFKGLLEALENYEGELKDGDAFIYDMLLTAIEEMEE